MVLKGSEAISFGFGATTRAHNSKKNATPLKKNVIFLFHLGKNLKLFVGKRFLTIQKRKVSFFPSKIKNEAKAESIKIILIKVLRKRTRFPFNTTTKKSPNKKTFPKTMESYSREVGMAHMRLSLKISVFSARIYLFFLKFVKTTKQNKRKFFKKKLANDFSWKLFFLKCFFLN